MEAPMKNKLKVLSVLCVLGLLACAVSAKEYHVSVKGSDKNSGSASMPFPFKKGIK